jgi:hypothetical protein
MNGNSTLAAIIIYLKLKHNLYEQSSQIPIMGHAIPLLIPPAVHF